MADNTQGETPYIFSQEDWRVLDSLEVRNLGALEGITDDMNKQIIRELTDGLNAGEGMAQLSKRIQTATGMAETRATTMARTETINAAVDGTRVRYEQAGITQFEYIAATDERTCGECAKHNGKIYDLDDNANMPPLHPNCRCAIAPIIGNRKQEILDAQKQKEKEAAEKAKQEAALKKKQKEEAAKKKAKQEAEKKKAEEELKKAKAEKEAAEKKAKEAEAARKKAEAEKTKAESALKKQPTLENLKRLEDPAIPYTNLEAPKTPRPETIQEPTTLSDSVRYYSGAGYLEINNCCRKVTKHKGMYLWTDFDRINGDIQSIDYTVRDKVITNKIILQNGTTKEVGNIYRGLGEHSTKELVSKYLLEKGDITKLEGIEISDKGFQSWTINWRTAKGFAKGTSADRTRWKYKVVLKEEVHPGTHGYFIGAASEHPSEGEVLRARGLINVVDDIKVKEIPESKTRILIIKTHLKTEA